MLRSVRELQYLSNHFSGIAEAEVFAETRAGIPVGDQRRFDVYRDVNE